MLHEITPGFLRRWLTNTADLVSRSHARPMLILTAVIVAVLCFVPAMSSVTTVVCGAIAAIMLSVIRLMDKGVGSGRSFLLQSMIMSMRLAFAYIVAGMVGQFAFSGYQIIGHSSSSDLEAKLLGLEGMKYVSVNFILNASSLADTLFQSPFWIILIFMAGSKNYQKPFLNLGFLMDIQMIFMGLIRNIVPLFLFMGIGEFFMRSDVIFGAAITSSRFDSLGVSPAWLILAISAGMVVAAFSMYQFLRELIDGDQKNQPVRKDETQVAKAAGYCRR